MAQERCHDVEQHGTIVNYPCEECGLLVAEAMPQCPRCKGKIGSDSVDDASWNMAKVLADQRTGPAVYCLAGCALFFGLPISMTLLAGVLRSRANWMVWRFDPVTMVVVAGVVVLSLAILRVVTERNRRQ